MILGTNACGLSGNLPIYRLGTQEIPRAARIRSHSLAHAGGCPELDWKISRTRARAEFEERNLG
jgi:hypothetical protein